MKHIAILRQPFFDLILRGEKTIESRWSMNRIAPYGKVAVGDTILLKESGKAVTAQAKVGKLQYFELTPDIVESIRIKYGKQIGMQYFTNYNEILHKKYCTLIWLEDVKQISPLNVPRSNGAGWLILK